MCSFFLHLVGNVCLILREQKIWNSLAGNHKVITVKCGTTKYLGMKNY